MSDDDRYADLERRFQQHVASVEARMFLYGYLLQQLFSLAYKAQNLTPEQIAQLHEILRNQAMNQQWPSGDPGHSALISGEVEAALADFLSGLERLLKATPRRPSG